ncbi:hypothetical protein Acor_57950 [Acrocarpospora corrugata]|uniref:Putative antitoxin VapB45-like DNA-binding HTH domain-containing protein n=1 Tax=Acrocarpospora corrugata TaxID=35763 RepID=A0A5M3W5Z9_9ACTN|nr:hypothetical protein Acor_57950 [Acrocarpospora corrugata]
MDDMRTRTGLLNQSDAARFLGIPQQTFNHWARGYGQEQPLLHVLPKPEQRAATVPFAALAEAHVLKALREAGVRPHKIKPALRRLQEAFGTEYVLLAPELATDGIDVLWDFSRTKAGAGLIEARSWQTVIREIVADYLQYVVRDQNGFPAMLRLDRCLPSDVIVDPQKHFGQPYFAGTGTRVAEAAAMLKAGEEPEVIADELGITAADVRIAARVLLGHAA